jgi:uncharacterized protein with HEPN domain
MPSKAADIALRDILHHIDLATGFAAGFELEAFKHDLKTIYAVTRAASRLSPKRRDACRIT